MMPSCTVSGGGHTLVGQSRLREARHLLCGARLVLLAIGMLGLIPECAPASSVRRDQVTSQPDRAPAAPPIAGSQVFLSDKNPYRAIDLEFGPRSVRSAISFENHWRLQTERRDFEREDQRHVFIYLLVQPTDFQVTNFDLDILCEASGSATLETHLHGARHESYFFNFWWRPMVNDGEAAGIGGPVQRAITAGPVPLRFKGTSFARFSDERTGRYANVHLARESVTCSFRLANGWEVFAKESNKGRTLNIALTTNQARDRPPRCAGRILEFTVLDGTNLACRYNGRIVFRRHLPNEPLPRAPGVKPTKR